MRVEREIAGFAFPFAAGVIAAVILGISPYTIKPTYPFIALATIFASVLLLSHPEVRRSDTRILLTIIFICALSCGIFTGMSGLELRTSSTENAGLLKKLAQSTGTAMQSVIDSIHFEKASTNGIIKALLTGNRSGMSDDIVRTFRASGASHILALSGLHLGIIYMIVSKVLAVVGNSLRTRRIKSVMIILICGLYTLATGSGASISRAFIFITTKEIAGMTFRRAELKNILAASLILHLAISPMSAKDVGFQLSYAAMFGIAYIFPPLRKMWKNDWRCLRWVWDSLALSISCQLTTGPLAYCYFGTFPQYFLLTNLLAIPLTGIIIPSALLTVILTAIGWCPCILIRITEWLTQTLDTLLDLIASI